MWKKETDSLCNMCLAYRDKIRAFQLLFAISRRRMPTLCLVYLYCFKKGECLNYLWAAKVLLKELKDKLWKNTKQAKIINCKVSL